MKARATILTVILIALCAGLTTGAWQRDSDEPRNVRELLRS